MPTISSANTALARFTSDSIASDSSPTESVSFQASVLSAIVRQAAPTDAHSRRLGVIVSGGDEAGAPAVPARPAAGCSQRRPVIGAASRPGGRRSDGSCTGGQRDPRKPALADLHHIAARRQFQRLVADHARVDAHAAAVDQAVRFRCRWRQARGLKQRRDAQRRARQADFRNLVGHAAARAVREILPGRARRRFAVENAR